MSVAKPPRLAGQIIRAVSPGDRVDEILGDLEERFQRARATGAARARVAYWISALACAWHFTAARRQPEGLPGRPIVATASARNSESPFPGIMDNILQDFAYALRSLRRAPLFAVVCVATLAVAVGANTAVFSVVWNVLLRPLPYANADELVMVWGAMTERDVERFPTSFPELRTMREQSTGFAGLAGVVTQKMGLFLEGRDPEQIQVGWGTDDLFAVLGVQPVFGRDFNALDAVPGGPTIGLVNQPISVPTAAVASHDYWRGALGGDPAAIGRTLLLDGIDVELVGVLPPDFELLLPPGAGLPERVDLWVALRPDYDTAPELNVLLRVVGRLRPGVSLLEAQADLDRVAAGERDRLPILASAGYELRVNSLVADLTRETRATLVMLMAAVGLVLLVACANVSSLVLVRAAARARETAVRAALGGSRWRLVRQFLAESAVLAALGGAFGVLLAAWAMRVLQSWLPEDLPRSATLRLDPGILLFTLGVSALATLALGAVPAWRSARIALVDALRSRSDGAGQAQARTRQLLVAVEMAVAVVLLVAATTLVGTLAGLRTVDPGFVADGAASFALNVPEARYQTTAERDELMARLQQRLEAVPGVEFAGAAFPVPFRDGIFWGRYATPDDAGDPSRFRQANYRAIVPGYLEAMATPLLEGRGLDFGDYRDGTAVVLVDDRLARALWPERSAIGETLFVRLVTPEPVEVRIVGVVANQRNTTLTEPGRDTIYFAAPFIGASVPLRWVVRGAEPAELVPRLRAAVAEIDPTMPLAEVESMIEVLDSARSSTRFSLQLMMAFAVVTVVLAMLGLYGVMASSVRQRRTEIGIRLALGAQRTGVRSLVLADGARLSLIGAGLGAVAAVGLIRLASSRIAALEPPQLSTVAVAALVFLGIAMLAAWIPARSAARVDPLDAMRN